jgi:hypothetical protein
MAIGSPQCKLGVAVYNQYGGSNTLIALYNYFFIKYFLIFKKDLKTDIL